MDGYEKYTVEDFVQEPYFRQWVLHPDAKLEAFWQAWIEKNPSRKAELQETTQLVRLIHTGEIKLDPKRKAVIRQNLLDQVTTTDAGPIGAPHPIKRRVYLGVAAMVALLITTMVFYLNININQEEAPQYYTVQTGAGEKKLLYCPMVRK
ncbi:MAG: hypothetical protein HC880_05355 [Bacteroidia bacterium]|nr:hypothetical protein [Bacteroidia bacterium]